MRALFAGINHRMLEYNAVGLFNGSLKVMIKDGGVFVVVGVLRPEFVTLPCCVGH